MLGFFPGVNVALLRGFPFFLMDCYCHGELCPCLFYRVGVSATEIPLDSLLGGIRALQCSDILFHC